MLAGCAAITNGSRRGMAGQARQTIVGTTGWNAKQQLQDRIGGWPDCQDEHISCEGLCCLIQSSSADSVHSQLLFILPILPILPIPQSCLAVAVVALVKPRFENGTPTINPPAQEQAPQHVPAV
jgi:hypothetical protein